MSHIDPRRRHPRAAHLAAALLLSLSAADAAAQQPSAADKATARDLLLDGRAKLAARDYEGALRSLKAAHAIMNVPTTGLDLARAQAANGQLVEARETALAVSRSTPTSGEAAAFGEARKQAGELAAGLAPRIPSLTITVSGAATGAEVQINGVAVPAATLGLPRKVNPGKNIITAKAPGLAVVTREIIVREAETLPVDIHLSGGSPPTSTGASPWASPSASAAQAPSGALTVSGDSPSRGPAPVWAWVSGGVGLVALGVGAAFFADHMSVRDAVARDCPEGVCDPSKQTAESAQALRAQWNRDLGLSIGMGALAVAGISVAIAGFTVGRPVVGSPAAGARAASSKAATPLTVTVLAGPTGVSLRGDF